MLTKYVLVNYITCKVFSGIDRSSGKVGFADDVLHGRRYDTLDYARSAKKLIPVKEAKELMVLSELDYLKMMEGVSK